MFVSHSSSTHSCLRSQPRSRSRWPHFQRSKAVRSEFLNEVFVSGPDPVHVHVGHSRLNNRLKAVATLSFRF